MSGGYFDYDQYRLSDMVHKLEKRKERINQLDEDPFDSLTEGLIEDAINITELAQIFLQRVDWLLSGDDCPETFKERLKEDMFEKQFMGYGTNITSFDGKKVYGFTKKTR